MYVCISTDCLSLLTSANQSISLSIYFSTYLSIHLYIYPFIYLFIYLPVYVCCLPIYFSVCQTTKIPDFLRVTQSVCLPANRSLLFRLLSLLLKMNAGSWNDIVVCLCIPYFFRFICGPCRIKGKQAINSSLYVLF
jgi:hypothetical protein